jgi:hypothetical protein
MKRALDRAKDRGWSLLPGGALVWLLAAALSLIACAILG